jgi:cytoskeletal protein CcmA (bactofilin family)
MGNWSLKAPASLLLAISVTLVFAALGRAQEETTRRAPKQSMLPAGSVHKGAYFAAGSETEISGTVEGDVYAVGGQVLIDGQVNGDVLVAGGRVRISGNVSQDVRAAGGQVIIAGEIGRNLTVAGGNVELAPSASVRAGLVAAGGNIDVAAPVGADAHIAAGNLVLANRIAGNVRAAVGTLRVASRAVIDGDLQYWSRQEAAVSEGARISGKVSRQVPPQGPKVWPAVLAGWIFFVATSFISTLILGLLSLRFLPGYHRSATATLRNRPWPSLGIGFVAAVVIPVICAILLAVVLTIPLALILLAAYFILLYWSRIFSITRIGELILPRRAGSGAFTPFILGLFVYYALALIPFVGWLVMLFAVLFGLGAELLARRELYVSARRQELL